MRVSGGLRQCTNLQYQSEVMSGSGTHRSRLTMREEHSTVRMEPVRKNSTQASRTNLCVVLTVVCVS